MQPVFLFLSHRHDRQALKAYRRLAKSLRGSAPLFMLYHTGDGAAPELPADIQPFFFSNADVQSLGFDFFRDTLVPGSTHFPLLHFARQHPGYSHYWVIEYDVYFSGNWQRLFEHYADNQCDFVASHIRHHQEEPNWLWWPLTHPEQDLPIEQRLRSFCPVYRMSAAAIAFIDEQHRHGWRGHYEMLCPTLLHRGGFSLQDFGGVGSFVADGDRNRFYRDDESGDPKGRLRKGTMRYRPEIRFPGWRRNKLYHPVK